MCVRVCRRSPGDAEADGAHVGEHIVEQVVASSSGLQVDVEFGELQLDVIDVMEKQNQDPDVVISEGHRIDGLCVTETAVLLQMKFNITANITEQSAAGLCNKTKLRLADLIL